MKDLATNQYVVTRFMKQTSTLLTGQGATVIEARQNLAKAVEHYRANRYYLKPVGEIHSPGRDRQELNGHIVGFQNAYRKAPVWGK